MHAQNPSHAQLTARALTLRRGPRTVLGTLDLAVRPGDLVAVVGENGRGKSTLLLALAGLLDPASGEVTLNGTLALAGQEVSAEPGSTVGDAVADALAPALTALEVLDQAASALVGVDGTGERAANAYDQALTHATTLDAWDAERRLTVALGALGAETDLTRELATLSGGQRHRVRLACLLGGSADFLLLDEPTNHLDADALDFLATALRERAGGVVLVSHDRHLLHQVGTTFLDLDPSPDGRPRVFGGGYEAWQAGREAARVRWEQEHRQQSEQRERLESDLRTAQDRLVSGWRPPKGTGKHQRSTRAGSAVGNVKRRADALEAAALPVPPPPPRFVLPTLSAPNSGASAVSAAGVTVAGRLAPTSLTVESGGRLIITGPNGAGKSTLLDVLAGVLTPDAGTARIAASATLAHLRQESIADAELPLSVGQRRRRDLAGMLRFAPDVLLLDEPTNHLGAGLVDDLTAWLRKTPATVVVVTHDRQLLADLADWPRLELTPAGGVLLWRNGS